MSRVFPQATRSDPHLTPPLGDAELDEPEGDRYVSGGPHQLLRTARRRDGSVPNTVP